MAFPLSPWLLWSSLVVGVLFGVIYMYVTLGYDYWKKRGVPYKKPTFPFGNFFQLVAGSASIMDFYKDLYEVFQGQRYVGCVAVGKPILLVRDPELIKSVLVKDFSHFHDRGFPSNEEYDPMTANLFNMAGSRWHALRNKLSPTFTSGKMKFMFPFVRECAEHLQKTIENEGGRLGKDMEIKDVLARYTTDVIGTVAFGVDVSSLENPDAEFRVIGRQIFEASVSNSLRNALVITAPELSVKLGIQSSNPAVTDFFIKIVKETVSYREKNNVKRSDFLQLLMSLKDEAPDVDGKDASETRLTMNQLAAQCFVFFLGGFETSATLMTFILYELSQNTDVQQKLRCEVDKVLKKHGGQITYESLAEMHLMDRIISETLRKYPAVPVLFRECTKEYTIPEEVGTMSNGQDWKSETKNGGHVIEMGTKIQIPISGLHYDPMYFPDPERFDPERFTEEAKESRPYYTYLPFGEGPRICIGMRFGNMQTKTGLAALISKFEFRPSTKTPSPLVLDKRSFIPVVKHGMWIKTFERSSM